MLKIPVGVSNRHLHLTKEDMETLFGSSQLSKFKDLKQPCQYASAEKVDLVGPKGKISGVRVLGPFRGKTQVELSKSDAIKLGINPPLRDSGDLTCSSGLTIVGHHGQVDLADGVIIAHRHIHISTSLALEHGLKDKQMVAVRAEGSRALVFERVLVRTSDKYTLEFHVDIDEANAAFLSSGNWVTLVGL